jgi:hypothetical protein
MTMNWKGFGRKQSWPSPGTIQVFVWRDCEKPWKISVRMSSVPAKIRTDHLPSTSLERYLQTILFSGVVYTPVFQWLFLSMLTREAGIAQARRLRNWTAEESRFNSRQKKDIFSSPPCESHGTHDLILRSDDSGSFPNYSPHAACQSFGRSVKLLLVLASTVIPGFRSPRDRWRRFLFSPRHVLVQKLGLLFNEGRGQSLCVGATSVAPQFQHEYIRAVTAARSLQKPEGSLPYTQQPATWPEANEFSTHTHNVFLWSIF